MTKQNQNTFNNSQQEDTQYINYAINNVLLNLTTLLPAQITAIDGLRCTVQPIINIVGLNQPAPSPTVVENVPLCQLIGGNSGIIIQYKVGDVVLCGAIQRDISSIKQSWSQANPASNRKFRLSDVVVLFKLSNTLPNNFVRVTDSGIDIKTSGGQPINVTTSGTVTVDAGSIILGAGATSQLLGQGMALTANIAGVQAGMGVTGVALTVTAGGSSIAKVKV